VAHPPAWYRDPRDPARVRRWDGTAWTDEVRPLPDWLRTLQLSAGPAASSRSGSASGRGGKMRTVAGTGGGSSRMLWWTSAALLLAGGLVMAFLGLGERTEDPDRLDDRSFARAADDRCAATGSALGTGIGRVLEGDAEVARIERITSAWELTAVDLRALPVAPADARKVDAWLDTWDRWVRLGHDYAEGLRAGDDVATREAFDAAAAPKAELRRFAVVNDMDDCAFR
jgi:hypothetical protein